MAGQGRTKFVGHSPRQVGGGPGDRDRNHLAGNTNTDVDAGDREQLATYGVALGFVDEAGDE